jgi:hypothetical protein
VVEFLSRYNLRLAYAGSLTDIEVMLIYLWNKILPPVINAEAKEQFILVPIHEVPFDNSLY